MAIGSNCGKMPRGTGLSRGRRGRAPDIPQVDIACRDGHCLCTDFLGGREPRMPKKVDHTERGEAFLRAAYRVIKREGFAGVTVRSVAKEAGFTTGALVHYVDSMDQLLVE